MAKAISTAFRHVIDCNNRNFCGLSRLSGDAAQHFTVYSLLELIYGLFVLVRVFPLTDAEGCRSWESLVARGRMSCTKNRMSFSAALCRQLVCQ
eukprot:scaffold87198_cov14-Prasinocladus_malaysianus.AAC.1